MVVGALGVVFGDIGTSPLYTLRETFTHGSGMTPTPRHVLGVLSILFWVDHAHRDGQVRHPDHARRQQGRGRRAGAGDARHPGPQRPRPQHPALDHAVRGGRARPVLWRRHHHAGDDRDVAPSRASIRWRPASRAYVVPMSLVILVGLFMLQSRGTARCRPAVRAGHAGVVPGAGRAGRLADRQVPAGAAGAQPDVRHRPDRRPRHRHLLGLRLDRAGRDRRRGAVRRHGPFRPQADPARLARASCCPA